MTRTPTSAERVALSFLAKAGNDGIDEADLIAHIERNNRVIHQCRVRDFSTAWRLMHHAFEHIRSGDIEAADHSMVRAMNRMVRIVARSEAVIACSNERRAS